MQGSKNSKHMNEQYIAIIQAGGQGVRMRELTHDKIPKPLLHLNGKPMMEWQIESLVNYGVDEFLIIVGHLGNLILDYFGDGSKWNIKISYIMESEPLGSAGALYYAKEIIGKRDVIFIFGDVMFELDWNRFIRFHKKCGGVVTLLSHPNAHPFDSDILIVDENSMITAIDSKTNIRNYNYKNCVNAGLSIFNNELLVGMASLQKTDYESELIKPLITEGKVFAYNTPEYVKDIGTPERFYTACEEQKQGLWMAKCLSNRQKAVFLDRDGTINILKGFLKREQDFELLPGVIEAIKKLNNSEYLTIVVTNQSVIARGECTFDELDNIHKKLETVLGEKGAFINDLYFCPHHPHKGYKGEIAELKIDCECRKPKIGMIQKAVEKYNIDLKQSWYIGDTTVDIQTGINAGMKTILVLTGEAGNDGKYTVSPTYKKNNLLDAVSQILD